MSYIAGLYTGVQYITAQVDNASQVATVDGILQAIVNAKKQDSVVAIVMMPTRYITQGQAPAFLYKNVARPTAIDGYTPKNKKLLTYPYNFLCVDSLNDSKNYRYEWFDDPTECTFVMSGGMTPNPEIVAAPAYYNGYESDQNWTETITCSGFPQCAFSIDAYRAWLAQKAAGEIFSLAGAGAGIVAGGAVGGPVGAAVGGVLGAMGIGSSVVSMIQEATQGAKARGSVGSSTEVATRNKEFYFKRMGVTREYAMMIDDFFNRYGYASCRVKVPNINVRPHWTYTKTQNCSMGGDIPADDMVKIKNIFNKGITFWPNAAEVGNYNLDNSPNIPLP